MAAETQYIALCPACSARLPMNDSYMEIADGNIRCGKCNTAFYAPDHLLRGFYSPAQETTFNHLTDSELLPFNLADPDNQSDYSKEDSKEDYEETYEEADDDPYEEPYEKSYQEESYEQPHPEQSYQQPYEQPHKKTTAEKRDEAPSFPSSEEQVISHPEKRMSYKQRSRGQPQREEKKRGLKKWLWIPAICILLVILGLQALIVNISSWSNHPLLRGAYSHICAVGLCDLPVALKPVSLVIEVAGYKRLKNGSYEIRGLLTNWAYYSQKLPVIRLSFVDLAETERFSMTLKPDSYLASDHQSKESLESEEAFHFSVTVNELDKETKHLFPRMDLVSY